MDKPRYLTTWLISGLSTVSTHGDSLGWFILKTFPVILICAAIEHYRSGAQNGDF